MKTYRHTDAPLKLFGVPFFYENGKLERLPEKVREQVPSLSFYGRRCPGGRLSFRTDSKKFTVKITFETLSEDIGMSIYACQSANVLIGDRKNATFAGIVNPPDYKTKVCEKTFRKSDKMEDVTVFFPRNEVIESIEISIEDEASIEAPTPYKYEKPILYYGSSITEGGCCTRVSNAYNAIISNRLDVDYYNLGFSGSAKGETAVADYINTIDMSIFVMAYDHNAPTPEHLQATHEPFFKRIREKNPLLPIVMIASSGYWYYSDMEKRRDIIKQTYINAKNSGDENVYFIDGGEFFDKETLQYATIDCIHPNDLGFYLMAEKIQPVIENILKKQNTERN